MHNPIDPFIPVLLGKIALVWVAYVIFSFTYKKDDYSVHSFKEDSRRDNDMEAFVSCDATDDPAAFAWFQDRKK